MAGTLFVVATPIGNLEDITVRALRILREVAVIAAEDTRRTAHLLARYGIATPTTALHEHNERAKSRQLLARLAAGESVAVVSDAGTPTISDPGSRLVALASEAGVRVEPIPGPSALMAALSVSGLPADAFTFLGFPPIRAKDRSLWFDRLAKSTGTVVFYEAPHRIRATLMDLQRVAGDIPVTVCRELTKTHEELVKKPISGVLSELLVPKGEFTVVLEIGCKTNIKPVSALGPELMAAEFGRVIDKGARSRRQAISLLSRRYGLNTNEVYEALEAAKNSGG